MLEPMRDMSDYHGCLEAYWEQGWEGRIEYSLAVDGWSHPFILVDGQYLTIFAPDGAVLWQGWLHFVGRGRERHRLPTGIWAYTKQKGLSYGQWMAWFLHQPPLRATVLEPRLPVAPSSRP